MQPGIGRQRRSPATRHHPRDLIPPRGRRAVEEARRQEEGRRDCVCAQDRKGVLPVVAVAVVERDRETPVAPAHALPEFLEADNVEVLGEQAHLGIEVVGRRAPDAWVEHLAGAVSDPVVRQDDRTAPRRYAKQKGSEPRCLEEAVEHLRFALHALSPGPPAAAGGAGRPRRQATAGNDARSSASVPRASTETSTAEVPAPQAAATTNSAPDGAANASRAVAAPATTPTAATAAGVTARRNAIRETCATCAAARSSNETKQTVVPTRTHATATSP